MNEEPGRENEDAPHPLSFLGDVPLSLSVELGATLMTVRRLLGLAKGSIIQLEAPQGEPLTVRANGNAVARGEVVSVNGHYGVRITEIQDPDGSSR